MTEVSTSPGLVVSRRVSQPFVFRSGGPFGSGKKVWTIRAAIRHMDRYPKDGVYHLRNGTLARWLDDQGAHDLAELARKTARQPNTDPRVSLEAFLIGTGLMSRPRLSLKPREVRLGYVLAGQSGEALLRVRKGRGRGYLFGTLRSADPWLRVDPNRFSGRPMEAVVQVNTANLPIGNTPHSGTIMVESSATEEPVAVPLRVLVVGTPSRLHRYVVRPLVGMAMAGLIGAGLGWMLGLSGVGIPTWLPQFLADKLSAAGFWALLAGVIWAVMGAIQGFTQPEAWPVTYANARWLLRAAIWALTFAVLVIVGLWTWQQFNTGIGLPLKAPSRMSTLLAAVSLAIFPAILGEILAAKSMRGRTVTAGRQPLLRPGLLVGIALLLGVGLVAGARLADPLARSVDIEETVVTVQNWAESQWAKGETRINQLIDQATLRYYDRRAPGNVDNP